MISGWQAIRRQKASRLNASAVTAKGSRPSQTPLTANNDLSETASMLAVVDAMLDGLSDHDIDRMDRFFRQSFRWIGNAGCGYKVGLNEFQQNWQRPFQKAFSDKICVDEARVTEGEWCSAFGRQEEVHSGDFMGIPATHKKIEIRYMDFWKVVDGKIVDNWVMVDFPSIRKLLYQTYQNPHKAICGVFFT